MSQSYRRIVDDSFLEHCSENVRRAYEYWNAKRGDRSMPSRADIDPSEIRDLLPGIILVGTDEVEARGSDPTGRDVREHVFAVTAEDGYRTYLMAIELRRPVFDEEPMLSPNPRLSDVGSLVMPLSADGREINMLMAYIDYRRNR